MKRLLSLIALGFVVLTGSTVVGVHLAERGARERRAQRFAERVLESIVAGDELHRSALGASELEAIAQRTELLEGALDRVSSRFGGDRWELGYCTTSGDYLQIWVPDPNPERRARLFFGAPEGADPPC